MHEEQLTKIYYSRLTCHDMKTVFTVFLFPITRSQRLSTDAGSDSGSSGIVSDLESVTISSEESLQTSNE